MYSQVQVNLCQKLFFLQNMLCTETEIVLNVENNFCTQHILPHVLSLEFSCNELVMNNMSSYCGLVDAKIRASDKDYPVQKSEDKLGIKKNHQSMLVVYV